MAIALAVSASAAEAASSDSTDITITGIAENICNIPSAPTNTGGAGMTLSGGATDAVQSVSIDDLVDDATGGLNASSITLTFANGVCNYNANVGIQSANGGMTGPATQAGFLNRVDYTATASFGIATATITTAGITGVKDSQAVGGSNLGDLVVNLTVTANATPLVADICIVVANTVGESLR